IGLRAYGQRDPLVEYKGEAFRQFEELTAAIRLSVVRTIYHVQIQRAPERPRPLQEASTNRDGQGSSLAPLNGQQAASVIPGAVGKKTTGRNDPCPCGSGRKFKKCHGR